MLYPELANLTKIAHISDTGIEEPVLDHLLAVAETGGKYAKAFGAKNWAYLAGLYHDIGKYSEEFQYRIRCAGPKVDHSTAGAYELFSENRIMTYLIAGHHGGIPNGGFDVDDEEESSVWARMHRVENGHVPDYSDYVNYVTPEMRRPLEPFTKLPVRLTEEDAEYTLTFFMRMLFSCLVDADWIETERFMRDGKIREFEYDSLAEIAERFEAERIARFGTPKTKIDKIRNKVSEACFKAAKLPQGFFSLDVPTGGGKTLASMRFALQHAKVHNLSRIIYAIPFTSIIDQNANTFKDVLGEKNVLEHHGAYDFGDDTRMKWASENWDVPIITTTNVQFFESFYSSLTSRCRKLHNICNSVIILDEVQALPTQQMKACIRALIELEHNYGCSIVFCTATQPPMEDFLGPYNLKIKEIIPDPDGLHKKLERVSYKEIGKIDNEELAIELNSYDQVLCIVNSRKQAQDIYELLDSDGAFHLSTSMYPAHRKETIAAINERMAKGLPCRVISTSVIEAGVDLDFPAVYRASAGLDSIVQAGGRCNRNNRLSSKECIVRIFDSIEEYTIPQEVEQKRSVTKSVVENDEQIDKAITIENYFRNLYAERNLDTDNVLKDLSDPTWGMESIPFRDVSQKMHLIKEKTYPVIYPNDITRPIIAKIESGDATKDDIRTVELYTMSLYENHKNLLSHHLRQIGDDEENPMYVLEDTYLYDDACGLIQM